MKGCFAQPWCRKASSVMRLRKACRHGPYGSARVLSASARSKADVDAAGAAAIAESVASSVVSVWAVVGGRGGSDTERAASGVQVQIEVSVNSVRVSISFKQSDEVTTA